MDGWGGRGGKGRGGEGRRGVFPLWVYFGLLCPFTGIEAKGKSHFKFLDWIPFGESLAVRAVTVGTTEVSGVCCDGRYCMYSRWACIRVCVCTVFKS